MKQIFTIVLCGLCASGVNAAVHKETIRKEMALPESKNAVLLVENIFGNIEVEGYQGKTVVFEIQSEISAGTEAELKAAIEKVFLAFETRNDTVNVFPDGLCGCHQNNRSRNFDWHQCDFKFKYDFKIKVPEQANINVSTVNEGEVVVRRISGEVVARNVNGGIFASEISGRADIHTINGKVEVRYARNPSQNSKYYSLNGSVNVYYSPELSADLSFKSFNGDMYTNFSVAENLPPVISKSEDNKRQPATYRIEKKTAVRIGKGGVKLDFETFNGDVFIRKI
jgi:hypothetical protein